MHRPQPRSAVESRARPRTLGALLSAVALLAACEPASEADARVSASSAPPAASEPRSVKVAAALDGAWPKLLLLSGELVPADEATLAAKVPGRIEQVFVDLGSTVKAGDAVAQIETRDLALRRDQAAAALAVARAALGVGGAASDAIDVESMAIVREAVAQCEQARRELERQKSLFDQAASSQSTLDLARTEVAEAESRLQAARETVQTRQATVAQRRVELGIAEQMLADARIVAPFDGRIAARDVSVGSFVAVGDPLARLLRTDPVRLRLAVPERSIAGVAVGQELLARFDSGLPDTPGRIARVAPALGSADRSLVVEADLPNGADALRPGLFARAELVIDSTARATTIPPAALVRFAGIEKVFVVSDDGQGSKAMERRVRTGRIDAQRIEVLEGLKPGEWVVLEPGRLQDGAAVRVNAAD